MIFIDVCSSSINVFRALFFCSPIPWHRPFRWRVLVVFGCLKKHGNVETTVLIQLLKHECYANLKTPWFLFLNVSFYSSSIKNAQVCLNCEFVKCFTIKQKLNWIIMSQVYSGLLGQRISFDTMAKKYK